MKHQWRCPTEETALCNSDSDVPLFTPFHPKYQPIHGIPTGTVATRILELQNLSKKSGQRKVFSPDTSRREQTRTGYGRREEKCFAKPASRSSRLDGSENQHSFPVRSGFLADHMQEHAVADGVTTWDRSGRLNSLLKPRGLCEMVQDDIINPSRALRKSKSCRNTQRLQNQPERKNLKTRRSVSLLNASMPPSSPARCKRDQRLLGREEIPHHNNRPTQQPDTDGQGQSRRSPERGSTQTTQSMRKQSVRDLYHQYGIERPAGLASEDDDTTHLEQQNRFCHACLFVRGSNSRCSNCEHRFCRFCNAQSPHSTMEKWLTRKSRIQAYYNRSRNGQREVQSSFQNKQKGATRASRTNGPTKTTVKNSKDAGNQDSTQERSRLNAWKGNRDHICGNDSELLKEHPEISMVRHGDSKFRRGLLKSETNLVGIHPRVPDCQIHRSQKSVRNDDDLILPMTMNVHVDHHDYRAGHHYRYHQNYSNREQHCSDDSLSGSSTEREASVEKQNCCDSSSCRATHSGHSPYRHSISCRKRRTQNVAQKDLERSGEIEMTEAHELESLESAYRQQDYSNRISKQHDSNKYGEPSPQTQKRASRDNFHAPVNQEELETGCFCQDTYRNPLYQADIVPYDTVVQPQLRKLQEFSGSIESTEFLVTPTRQKMTTFPPWKNHDTKTTVESMGVNELLSSTESRPRRATMIEPQQSLHTTVGQSFKADFRNEALQATIPQYSHQNSVSRPFSSRDGNAPVDVLSKYSMNELSSNESKACRSSQRRTSNTKVRREPSPKSRMMTRGSQVTVPSSEVTLKSTSDRSISLSRRVSSFFKVHGRGSPAPLSKRVYDDQEEQRRFKNNDDSSGTNGMGFEKDPRKNPDILLKRMQLRRRIKDKKPREGGVNNFLISQHELYQDDFVDGVPETPQHELQDCVTPDLQLQMEGKVVKNDRAKDRKLDHKMMIEDTDHDCIWKQMILEHQDRSIPTTFKTSKSSRNNPCGIVGAEIIMHMEGGEDVVLKACLNDDDHDGEWKVGNEKA